MSEDHASAQADGFKEFGGYSSDLYLGLFDRARSNLTEQELIMIADNSTQDAESMVEGLARLAEGLLCLIRNDGQGGARTGSFQTAESLAQLLYVVHHTADTASGRLRLAEAADHQRRVLMSKRSAGG